MNSNLSVLVINKEEMGKIQDSRQNILTYFLLSSDLKGVIETPYHTSLTNKDPLLFKNNYILNGLSKTEFIELENSVYVNYSDNDFNLLEIYY